MVEQKRRILNQSSTVRWALAATVGVLATATVALAADGDLDTTFDTDGIVVTDIEPGSTENVLGITVQPDGKIILTGKQILNGFSSFLLARYDTDGSLDPSFDTDGIVITDVTTSDQSFDVLLQPDGKILLAGTTRGALNDYAILRYNADGSLDTSFGTSGVVQFDAGRGANDQISALALRPDGTIVASGYTDVGSGSNDFVVMQFDTNGSLDTSFGTNGIVETDLGGSDYASRVLLDSSGKIILAGFSDADGTYDAALVRYNADGTLDNSFGTNGITLTDIGTDSSDRIYGAVLRSDGRIVLAGDSDGSGTKDFVLVRYNTDGSVDTSFGTSGITLVDIGTATNDEVRELLLQSDGVMFAAGWSGGGFAVARFSEDGSLDTSFGTSGVATGNVGLIDVIWAAALQPDGKVVLGGHSFANGGYDALVVRLGNTPPATTTTTTTATTVPEGSSTTAPTGDTTTTAPTGDTTTSVAGATPTTLEDVLPATGGGTDAAMVGLLLLAAGLTLVVVSRRRAARA